MGSWPPGMEDEQQIDVNVVDKAGMLPGGGGPEEEGRPGPRATDRRGSASPDCGSDADRDRVYLELGRIEAPLTGRSRKKQQQQRRTRATTEEDGGSEERGMAVLRASQIRREQRSTDGAEMGSRAWRNSSPDGARSPDGTRGDLVPGRAAEIPEGTRGGNGSDSAGVSEGTRAENAGESKPGTNQSCASPLEQQQQQREDSDCRATSEGRGDAASPSSRLQGEGGPADSLGAAAASSSPRGVVPWTLGVEPLVEPPGAGLPPRSEESQPGKRHVYCTVYCVENDHPGDGPGAPCPAPAPLSLSSSPPGGLELELFRPPGPFSVSSLIESSLVGSPYAGDYGRLIALTCRVCLEDKQIKPLPCCKKAVCEECLKRYLSSQVQLGQAELKCPITECSEHLDETTVLYNLPHDDIIKYKYFLELSRMDSSTKPCPQCKHFTTFKRKGHIPTPTTSENKFKIQCPSCQFVWCFKCHSPWHEGVNCKEYRKGDKLLRHWANEVEHGQRNAQKCPKCKIHIQRTEGCDHMTCSQCNTNFCYRCGERYRQLRFFGDHTSNLSIFGCKYRYLPERPHLRRLVRGSVCAGKLLIAPLALVLGLALGAITVLIGLFVFPIYCLCKKQRKRTRTGMPW
ncbi:probable E3 ubiquitin-protein ligase RNF217 [Rhinatrema bivittatum]|uniref:probable E3 ubiquitin-protein ligase RNF217 n=1 Tax=Rhinatrema bivittatum TaxID=194408 RepID=UPI00112E0D6B|nr:probable E3 ubiquitin-protein ligase RNF217 [Rhinatrema bivittatum]